MQKAIRHILQVMSRVLFTGLSIQIILGFTWIIGNLGDFQEFGDSLSYLQISDNFMLDKYTGALYPVLLMLARGIEGLLRIPYTYVVQVLQLGAAGCAGYFFLNKAGVQGRWLKMWGSMVLLTFPMIAQCHLAILPNSLLLSALLAELAFVADVLQREEYLHCKQLFSINLCWLAGALLVPEYLWFGAVPVVLLLGYNFVRFRKQTGMRYVYHVILVAAFVGMIVGIGDLTQREDACGKPVKTIDSVLLSRFAWTSLCDYYDEWPQEMRDACPYNLVVETTQYADNMERLLQPQAENVIGAESAQGCYRQIWKYAWNHNKGQIIHEIVWDVIGYTFPTVAMQMLLEGRGYDSYVGRNYEIMRRETPRLTKWYVDYSSWWFVVGMVLTSCMEVLFLLLRKNYKIFLPVICLMVSGVFAVWYTMQGAGMWDYKNTLFTGAMWLLWMLSAMLRGKSGEGCNVVE